MSHQDTKEIDRWAAELALAVNQSDRFKNRRHKVVHGDVTVQWVWSDHGTMVSLAAFRQGNSAPIALADARVLHYRRGKDDAAVPRACRIIAAHALKAPAAGDNLPQQQ